jgi:hypothetical protein
LFVAAQEEGAAPLEVADAARWKRTHHLEGVPVVKYDWTYSSCYRGTLLASRPEPADGASGLDTSFRVVRAPGRELCV